MFTSVVLAIGASVVMATVTETGTTAIAVWTPTRVILAADSKVTRRNDAAVADYQICKTRIIGNYAVTAAGMFNRPAVGFDAWNLIDEILSSSQSLTEIERRIRDELAPALARALGDARGADPQGFARDFHEYFFAVAVAGNNGRVPAMVTVHFLRDGNDGMRAESAFYPRPGTPVGADDIGLSIMGEHEAIDRDYPDARLIPLLRADVVAAARALVELQIERTPDKVGPPVSVLEVIATDIRLLDAGACGR